MSAASLSACPKCLRMLADLRENELKSLGVVLSDSVGRDVDDRLKRHISFVNFVLQLDLPDTLEDVFLELGIGQDNQFHLAYQGECSVCNYGVELDLVLDVTGASVLDYSVSGGLLTYTEQEYADFEDYLFTLFEG